MIKGFDHVAIPMADVEAMLDFYRGLGFGISDDYGGRVYSVQCGDNKINLHSPVLWQTEKFTLGVVISVLFGPAPRLICTRHWQKSARKSKSGRWSVLVGAMAAGTAASVSIPVTRTETCLNLLSTRTEFRSGSPACV